MVNFINHQLPLNPQEDDRQQHKGLFLRPFGKKTANLQTTFDVLQLGWLLYIFLAGTNVSCSPGKPTEKNGKTETGLQKFFEGDGLKGFKGGCFYMMRNPPSKHASNRCDLSDFSGKTLTCTSEQWSKPWLFRAKRGWNTTQLCGFFFNQPLFQDPYETNSILECQQGFQRESNEEISAPSVWCLSADFELEVTNCDGRDFPAFKTWNHRKMKFQCPWRKEVGEQMGENRRRCVTTKTARNQHGKLENQKIRIFWIEDTYSLMVVFALVCPIFHVSFGGCKFVVRFFSVGLKKKKDKKSNVFRREKRMNKIRPGIEWRRVNQQPVWWRPFLERGVWHEARLGQQWIPSWILPGKFCIPKSIWGSPLNVLYVFTPLDPSKKMVFFNQSSQVNHLFQVCRG